MVPTPTLTASASNSAISASDNPESCWRLSAQNQTASGRRALRWPSASTSSRIAGRTSAAPSSNAASTANPDTSELPNHSRHAAAGEHGERQRALQYQPAVLRLLPGVGLRRRQHRKPDRLHQARGRRRQRAEHADGKAGDPPFAASASTGRESARHRVRARMPRHRAAATPRSGSRRSGRRCPRAAPATPVRPPAPYSAGARIRRRRASVRSIGSRCSKASPIAELTMNRPTTKDSRPNAVRLR